MLGYASCSETVGGAPSFCHCGMPCTFCASAEIDENAWGIRNKGHLVKGQLVKIRTLTEQFIRSASLNTSSLNYIVSLIRDTACTAEPSAILWTAERSSFSLSAPLKSQKSSAAEWRRMMEADTDAERLRRQDRSSGLWMVHKI